MISLYVQIGAVFFAFVLVARWAWPDPEHRWYHPFVNALLWPISLWLLGSAFWQGWRRAREREEQS